MPGGKAEPERKADDLQRRSPPNGHPTNLFKDIQQNKQELQPFIVQRPEKKDPTLAGPFSS